MIEVKNLTRNFDEFVAVDKLNFSVKPGEVLGFLGPNGAGKSTTMKMLTGFLTPSAGTASIMGHDIVANPIAAKNEIGYLPEGAPTYGDMTVQDYLSFIADVRSLTGDYKLERIATVIAMTKLEKVLLQSIETLSKGYKRRVGLAQALIHDPKVLILDEPTDGLDPNQKHQVRNLIKAMAKDKIIIISTHILEEVLSVCTRAMIIGRGKLIADGTPEDLAARSPRHGTVNIEFVQTVPENVKDKLHAIAGVLSIEQQDNKVSVLAERGKNILPAIVELVHQQHWHIQSLYQEQGVLDEVFRQLTKEVA